MPTSSFAPPSPLTPATEPPAANPRGDVTLPSTMVVGLVVLKSTAAEPDALPVGVKYVPAFQLAVAVLPVVVEGTLGQL